MQETVITKVTKKISWRKVIKKAGLMILILWVVFSISYIIRDQWLKYQFRQLQTAYQKGVADLIRAIMVQSANCQRINLQDGDKKIELIDVSCTKQ